MKDDIKYRSKEYYARIIFDVIRLDLPVGLMSELMYEKLWEHLKEDD